MRGWHVVPDGRLGFDCGRAERDDASPAKAAMAWLWHGRDGFSDLGSQGTAEVIIASVTTARWRRTSADNRCSTTVSLQLRNTLQKSRANRQGRNVNAMTKNENIVNNRQN